MEILSWDQYAKMDAEKKKSSFKYALVTHRPLYGGREVPLRWFLQISATIRAYGWKQSRCDVCAFLKHEFGDTGKAARLTSTLVLHVDDLLVVATEGDLVIFTNMMTRYKTGELERVGGNCEFTYLGLSIGRDNQGRLYLHQHDYIGSLVPIIVEDVIRNNKFWIRQEKWGTATRQMVGSLLRCGQTVFEICDVATHISTSAAKSLIGPILALTPIRLFNKTVRALEEEKW